MRIFVLNPNSTQAVTDGIAAALVPFADAARFDCATLAEGPPGIESDSDVAAVAEPVCRRIKAETADAAVIACFSDPGLAESRRAAGCPVYGISECAYREAATLGRFGVISILEKSVPRHLRYVEALGLKAHSAGDRAVGLRVTELADRARAAEAAERTGRTLIREDGAEVLILGCAGMAGLRDDLEAALGIPVIEPCQAAARAALAGRAPPSAQPATPGRAFP
jgi:Asp/Glu/hydantoin racemase